MKLIGSLSSIEQNFHLTDDSGRKSFNFFSVINLNPCLTAFLFTLSQNYIYCKILFLFLQFTSSLHLHTASLEDHFEVDHCDHCSSAGLFHSSQDQPESLHYLINKSRLCCHDGKTKAISHCPEARKENMFGLYEVQNVCLQRVIQDAYESNFGCQKFCQKSEKVK